MDVTVGDILSAVSTGITGALATWGALSVRVRGIEEKYEATRKSQGERIGVLEDGIAELRGYVRGARYRTKTKPKGEGP